MVSSHFSLFQLLLSLLAVRISSPKSKLNWNFYFIFKYIYIYMYSYCFWLKHIFIKISKSQGQYVMSHFDSALESGCAYIFTPLLTLVKSVLKP
jgi:hypothetical protein